MEYRERAGSAAYAVPDERAGFIRRTYAHLAFAVLGAFFVVSLVADRIAR